MNPIRVAIITNIPTPYRDGVYDHLCENDHISIKVIYCNKSEPNRNWKSTERHHPHAFLDSKQIASNGQYIHISWSIVHRLSAINPDVVISSGYGPVMLQALLWAKLKGKKHIVFTDGSIHSERALSKIHKLARRIFFGLSSAFIGASDKSINLFSSYGIRNDDIFKSCLCVNNKLFLPKPKQEKQYDILFVGQMIERKMPLFFADVAEQIQKQRGSCSALLIGSGPLLESLKKRLDQTSVDYQILGFIQPAELPKHYASSRIFLFPTEWDPWGVVANEACASGLPVLTTSEAGVAGELVIHRENGFIIPADIKRWAATACELLDNEDLYKSMSKKAILRANEYNVSRASDGIVDAITHSLNT